MREGGNRCQQTGRPLYEGKQLNAIPLIYFLFPITYVTVCYLVTLPIRLSSSSLHVTITSSLPFDNPRRLNIYPLGRMHARCSLPLAPFDSVPESPIFIHHTASSSNPSIHHPLFIHQPVAPSHHTPYPHSHSACAYDTQ